MTTDSTYVIHRLPTNVAGHLLPQIIFALSIAGAACGQQPVPLFESHASPSITEVKFSSHDGHAMYGRLAIPQSGTIRAVVIRVQTCQGMTIGSARDDGFGRFDRGFDAYSKAFPEHGVAYFCYEGRGIRTGDKPPKFEVVDRKVYDTSTLDNKVRDVQSAISAVRDQPGCSKAKIFLLGASEGSLLAAEAAAKKPTLIDGVVLGPVLPGNLQSSLRFALIDGQFRKLLQNFDNNADGKITKNEYEADKKGFRTKTDLRNVEFSDLDANGDGVLTVDDLKIMCKEYLDALEVKDWKKLDEWVVLSGGTRPKGWLEDHFAHAPIWKFLEPLSIPVGVFHGQDDCVCSVDEVKKLERLMLKAKKDNIQFEYFDGHDHSLNADEFSLSSRVSKGQAAIISYVIKQLNK
jgi:alpha-beta hydrolase superfamily lysophospholipase